MNTNLSVPTEDQEQQAFVQWFRLQYPDIMIFLAQHCGGASAEAKMKAMTIQFTKLFIPEWKLFVKIMRTDSPPLIDKHKKLISDMQDLKLFHVVANGCEDAKMKVSEFRDLYTEFFQEL